MTRTAAFALALSLLAGCAVQTYRGARRPSQEVAFIESDGTRLTGLDEWRGRGDQKLEVLPGAHALAVRLYDDKRNGIASDGYHYSSKYSLIVCFVARPGHTYLARPVYSGRTWRPELVDESRAELIKVRVIDGPAAGCADAAATGDAD